jgi:acyl carrier protein
MEHDTVTTSIDEDLRRRAVDTLCALLPKVLGREMPDVSEQTRLMELELSSSSTLELMLELEETLDIQVDVEDFDREHLESIGTLATYIAGHSLA